MNIFKKLFGGQKTTEEVKQEKEKGFDKVKYEGVRALRMHQFDLAAKFLEQALQLNAEDLECRDYLSQAYISMGDLQKAYAQLQKISDYSYSILMAACIRMNFSTSMCSRRTRYALLTRATCLSLLPASTSAMAADTIQAAVS